MILNRSEAYIRHFGLFLILTAAIALSAGCRSYPRYRTGGAETAQAAVQAEGSYKTNDYLRLGTILQGYLGKPYSGKSKYVQGLDCSFFTSEVFKKFDEIEIPRTVKDQFRAGDEVTRRNLAYGDIVFFKTSSDRVGHVGIFVGEGDFIHASTSRGVIISSMSEDYWSKRFVGARKILKKRHPDEGQ